MNLLFALFLALFAGDAQADVRFEPALEYRVPPGRLNPALECGDPAKACPCGASCPCAANGRACECPTRA